MNLQQQQTILQTYSTPEQLSRISERSNEEKKELLSAL
jgi:hypothetical protein